MLLLGSERNFFRSRASCIARLSERSVRLLPYQGCVTEVVSRRSGGGRDFGSAELGGRGDPRDTSDVMDNGEVFYLA